MVGDGEILIGKRPTHFSGKRVICQSGSLRRLARRCVDITFIDRQIAVEGIADFDDAAKPMLVLSWPLIDQVLLVRNDTQIRSTIIKTVVINVVHSHAGWGRHKEAMQRNVAATILGASVRLSVDDSVRTGSRNDRMPLVRQHKLSILVINQGFVALCQRHLHHRCSSRTAFEAAERQLGCIDRMSEKRGTAAEATVPSFREEERPSTDNAPCNGDGRHPEVAAIDTEGGEPELKSADPSDQASAERHQPIGNGCDVHRDAIQLAIRYWLWNGVALADTLRATGAVSDVADLGNRHEDATQTISEIFEGSARRCGLRADIGGILIFVRVHCQESFIKEENDPAPSAPSSRVRGGAGGWGTSARTEDSNITTAPAAPCKQAPR